MSLIFSSNDGVHIERLNAEQMGRRGIFINGATIPMVKDDNGKTQSEHQAATFIQVRNNLNISPGGARREAFTKTPPKDVIFDCLKPIYNFLRALGVFPLSRNSSGEFIFKLQSPVMAYSLFIFVALMFYCSYILKDRIDSIKDLEGNFVEAVIAYLFIVNLFPLIILPMMWYESAKVARTLNEWAEFELIYRRTVGKELKLAFLKRKARLISAFLPLLSIGSVFLTHFVIRRSEQMPKRSFLFQVTPYCYIDTLTYMLGAYWYLLCDGLSVTARVLAEHFHRALKNVGPASIVSDYRALWLRLSKLTRDTGTATCFTFTFLNLYLFFVITLSLYGLISQISEGFGFKDMGLALTVVCSVSLLYFICDEGHNASFNVKTIFQKKILMVELTWMNSDAVKEINMFLRATEMSQAEMNLGGFTSVNRNLFKSLLATMVTYLVVLLQFQISIPADDLSAALKRSLNISGL